MKDFYDILGVAKTASEEDIKKAYRAKAKIYHPDLHPGDAVAEQNFRAVSEAYETLSSREKRAQYDNPMPFNDQFTVHGAGHNFDSVFRDIFQNFNRRQAPQNSDLTVQYNVKLEDAFNGTKTSIRFAAPDQSVHDIVVDIPAGITTGHRVRLPGHGDRTHANLPPGNLFVLINVEPHAFFQRIGQNLVCEIEIAAFDAILGTTVDVPTIEGGTIRVTIPPGTQFGTSLRVAQKGMRVLQTAMRGDLYVTIKVNIPKLSAAQCEKLREAKAVMNC